MCRIPCCKKRALGPWIYTYNNVEYILGRGGGVVEFSTSDITIYSKFAMKLRKRNLNSSNRTLAVFIYEQDALTIYEVLNFICDASFVG